MNKVMGLFAVDVDGTLITDHGHITEKVYCALEKSVSAGWELVIASGRTFYAARRVCNELPFLRYAVLSNGACIVDVQDQRVLHMETLSTDVTREIIRILRDRGTIPALFNTDIEDQYIYYDSLDGACEFFKWYVKKNSRTVRVDNVMAYTSDVLQIETIAEREVICDICGVLQGIDVQIVSLPFESTFFGGKNHDFWFLQIVGANATKHNALRRLVSWLGIPQGRLVAVGDNYNDADMIAHADIGIAMGNSPDEVKKLAKVVVGSNNDSGLCEVVEEVLLSGEYFPEPD